MRRRWLQFGLALLAAMPAGALQAQVAPRADEQARWSPAHQAAWTGDLATLQRLAAASKAVLQSTDSYGRTPLHVATFARRHEVIRWLLQAGADPGALESDRYDAVTIAAVADDEPTLALLFELGASAKLITSRYDGTALIAAAHLGHDGVVRRLIAAGAPLDHVNNLHWTALIEAVVLGDGGRRHQACVEALLKAGASTKLADRQGRTPLQLAEQRGYAAMVKQLRDAGAR